MTLPAYIGRYRIRSEIARGGFAVVLQAWDEDLESLVAIKILHRELAEDDEIQTRFIEEARLLRRIRSPNLVTVHDVGRLNDGRPYFVMDFADRGTLAPRLGREASRPGPDPQSLMMLVDAVAEGLSAIHEAGVVHRDIKPDNILFQLARRAPSGPDETTAGELVAHRSLLAADERVLVGDLGIAKDRVKRGSLVTLTGGTPLYEAPEQASGASEITASADIYSATALLFHVLTGRKPPEPDEVQHRLDLLPDAWHGVVEQGMDPDPCSRFPSIEGWRAAIQDVLAAEAAETRVEAMGDGRAPAATCPYKGLAAYQPEDATSFFGREGLIDELVRRLQMQRVLVVGGASGSGKSSLVRAGLIPALQAGALPGSETWRVALFTPGRDPLAELHFQIARAAGAKPLVSVDELLARPTLARHLGGTDGAERPLVLCIDQFEELFTLAPRTQCESFVAALSAMTDPADSRVRVVIAVRADFYAACAQLTWLAGRISENQVLVGPMTDSELRRAISEPARRVGLSMERSLVDAIIDEAGHETGSLPLVAHALVETWIRRQGNTLTLKGFREAGGVAGAISQTADATFERRFDSAEQQATKRLFLRLVTPGEGTPDTRRMLARSEIDRDSQPEVMHRVVDRLTEARLLTVDDATVQIAHEALLRTWPRLRGWIEESRDDLRMRQRITHAATEWDANGRDSDLLYRGTPLLSGLEWVARNPDQLGVLERTFLDASAEAKAEAEAVAAERRQRTRRVRRIAVGGLSFFAIGATLASVAAFVAFRQSEQNAERAALATAQARERFAGALGAAANGLVESDPLLAVSLAAEAIGRAGAGPPGYDARAALVAARMAIAQGGPFVVGSPIATGDALAIALSPDGALLAAGQRDGDIRIIDTGMRRQIGPSLHRHEGGVEDLDFASDGRRLVSVGDDGTLQLWNVDNGLGAWARSLGTIDDIAWAVRFDPTGKTVATAGEDGTVRLWDAAQGGPLRAPLIERKGDVLAVAFSPDGGGLVAGNGEGDIYGWTLPSGEVLFEPVRGAHTSDVWRLAFSPAGDRFATASSDGTSMVFDYPSGRVVGPAFDASASIGGVAFVAEGRVLVGGGADGSLRLWDVDHQAPIETTPSGHSQPVIDVEASANGQSLATLGRDQLIRLWSLAPARPVASALQVAGRSAKGVAFSPDGQLLAAGDESGAVQVWTPETGKEPLLLPGHDHQVWALAFSPDGTLLASADRAGQVLLRGAADGAERGAIAAHDGPIWSLAFTRDGQQLVTAGDTAVRVWDVATGSLEQEVAHEGGQITRAALSPDGASLALASTDGTVDLVDLESRTVTRTIAADTDVIWSVAFSPDGRRLAAASSDEVVTLWDVATGREEAALTGHTGGATDLTFLADGATLAVVDRHGNLHLWDIATGRRLAEAWPAHDAAIWRMALHPDGRTFATAGDDGQVKIWDMLSPAVACELGAAAFDAMRRRQYLGEGEGSVACDGPS